MSATTIQDKGPAASALPPVAGYWASFTRGLVETLDAHLDAEGRASLLRAVGSRMADAMPLAHCDTLAQLEARVNEALATAGFGRCEMALDVAAHRLVVTHHDVPTAAAGEDAEGHWVTAVLEGLYSTWLAEQPGADPSLQPSVVSYAPGSATLHYGRT